jgi:Tfp pilus assembly protein PilF
MRFVFLVAAVLAGCATPPAPEQKPEPPPVAPAPPAQKETVAVAGLMDSARAESAAGNHANAAASLERALRIEPRNPRLWQELARVRLQQRQFEQAESVAARSSSFAGSDNALRAENWRLIAEAREARGDANGARTARESADKLGR